MRRLTVMLTIWAALAAPVAAQAPDPAPLRLETVLQETLRGHPLLRSAAAELAAAEGAAMAAMGTFDLTARANAQIEEPSFYATRRLDAWLEQYTPLWGATLYGGYRLGRGDFAPYDAKLATNELGEWRGGVRLPLLQGGPIDRRRAEVEKQQLAVRLAALRLRQARLEQLRAAASRYWDWVAAGRRYRITRALLDVALTRDRDLRETIRLGETAAVEGVENARAIQARRAQLISAQRGWQQAAIELSFYHRTATGAMIRPQEDQLPAALPAVAPLPADRLEQAIQLAMRQRPEIGRLDAQADQARIDVALARNQHLPVLDLSSELSQDFGPGTASREPTNLVTGLNFSLPLQRRFARGREQAAEATLASYDAQLAATRDRLVNEVRDAASALAMAVEQVAVAEREVALATELVEAERERFRLGATSLLIVNIREQAASEAEIREIEARVAYHKAMASLRAVTTELLADLQTED